MADEIIGQKIIDVRPMTEEELDHEGWDDRNVTVIVLEDGTLLYPSKDEEGNGAGELFGRDTNGVGMHIYTSEK
jgi:hypothetical protein